MIWFGFSYFDIVWWRDGIWSFKTNFGGGGMLGSTPGRKLGFFDIFFFLVSFVKFGTIKDLLDVAGWLAGGQSEKFTLRVRKGLSAVGDRARWVLGFGSTGRQCESAQLGLAATVRAYSHVGQGPAV